MQAPLQTFCDNVEHVLNGVRGEMLVYQQNPADLPRFEVHTNRIEALLTNPDLCESAGIDLDLAALHSQTARLIDVTTRIPGDSVRSVLDRISDIEAKIAIVRIGDDDFSEDLDRLLDISLGLAPADEPEATISNVSAEDAFEIDAELLEIFSAEAEELLSGIEFNLQRLVASPGDKASLWEIRRNAHTFKGSAGLVGIREASKLAHRIEDLLDQLAERPETSTESLVPILLTATECLRSMTSGNESQRLKEVAAHLHTEFDRLAGGIEPETAAAAETQAEPKHEPVEKPACETRTGGPKPIVRVPIEVLDRLVGLVRELVVNRSLASQRFADLEKQVDELHNAARRLNSVNSRLEVDLTSALFEADTMFPAQPANVGQRSDAAYSGFHSLELDRYSELHESLRDLAETASDLSSIDQSVATAQDSLDELLRTQNSLFDEIQSRITAMRKVAFDTLRTRLERAIRVTCEDEGKNARLIVENGDTQIDTQMLDSLIEPLIHLLKNAVVHGIETPETRRLLGKPEDGTITVRVEHEDTHVSVTITDDGGGIAVSELRDRAVGTGEIDAGRAAAMSNEELHQLMFLPGITTARRLNLNAGRGVGMNIVKQNIEASSGTISVESDLHKGTRFTIRLPLKLAVTNALIVRCSGGIYAIPIKHIEQIVELRPEDIGRSESGLTADFGSGPYTLRSMDESLGLRGVAPGNSAYITALAVKSTLSRTVIALESVLRTEEIVIQPLAKPFDRIRDVLGVAFLSSGELAPIIDLPYMVGKTPTERVSRPVVTAAAARRLVMVVDDSPSVRHMTSRVVRNAGWDVIAAKDGVDAIEILSAAKRLPDLILSDIEMPRMGGFELARSLRENVLFTNIPVVVVTSRTADKHREAAKDFGVAGYLVKPYNEIELIETARKVTAERAERTVADAEHVG
ncbi:MAG: response regulator [Pyrinomonadaceae bacterium]|nr:response regulator [Pyrinomonadaceae bacterium]